MFGNTELSVMLGAPPVYPYEPSTIKKYVRTLAKAGLHVLLCAPETKVPVDMRTKKQREDDEAAGLTKAGVYLATDNTRRLDSYIGRYLKEAPTRKSTGPVGYGPDARLTLGVHLGPSRLVVIDADTAEEVEAVRHYWAAKSGIDVDRVPAPTVATPGQVDDHGTVIHSNGRHWYFRLPEGMELDPVATSSGITIEVPEVGASFTIKSGNSYVLIPPSFRNGNEYRLVATDVDLPLWVRIELDRATREVVDPEVARVQRETEAKDKVETTRRQLDMFSSSVANPFANLSTPVDNVVDNGPEESDEEDESPKAWDGETLDEQLESWSEATPWDEVLEPHGWTRPGLVESCGCEIWTRPVGSLFPSTPKSAVAHDETCTRSRTDGGHPAMHVWTDHLEGPLAHMIDERHSRTLSKLDVYAALNHDGHRGDALEAIGIETDMGGRGLMLPGGTASSLRADTEATVAGVDMPLPARVDTDEPELLAAPVDDTAPTPTDSFVMPSVPIIRSRPVLTPAGVDVLAAWGVELPDTETESEWRRALPAVGNFDQFRDMPPVKWSIDGLLERGGLTSVIGDSGTGKSAVVLDMACAMASGIGTWYGHECDSHPVIYIAGEGVSGAVERVKAWERANNASVGNRLWIVPESVSLTASRTAWGYISHLARGIGAGMIILDTFARMSGDLEENSAADMSAAVHRLDKVRATTGAGVLVVHHTTRGTRHGRGSTALNGAMDSELLLTSVAEGDEPVYDDNGDEVQGKAVTLSVSKQKNGPDDASVNLVLTEEADVTPMAEYDEALKTSMVVTDVNGRPARFMATYLVDAPARSFAPAKAESVEDTAVRVLEFVESFDTLESTITDIKNGVVPDTSRAGSAKAWGTHIKRSIDLLMSTGRLWRVGRSSSKFTADPPLDE